MNFIEKLRSRELRVMCVPAALHGIMKENISLWMAIYIVDVYSVNLKSSAYYILLIPVIGFAARMVYPMLLRFFKGNENAVSQIFFVVCACVSLLVCFSQIGMMFSVIALGVIYAAVSIINTSMLSIYPLRYTNEGSCAGVSGILDFATYFGAGVSSAIYGVVIKHFGYLPMFVSWLVISLFSAIILHIISKRRDEIETFC